MQMPVPRFSKLPITFSALAHGHFPTPITEAPAVYILRDGRDVFISHYWKCVNAVLSDNATVRASTLSKHPSLESIVDASEKNVSQNMAHFYKEWKVRPMGSRVNWGEHVSKWLGTQSSAPSLSVIKYEDMHQNPHKTLANAVMTLTGQVLDEKIVRFAIERNSFKAKTGRQSGEGNNQANRRRGVVGDWKDVFTETLSKEFYHDFSEPLAMGGYY